MTNPYLDLLQKDTENELRQSMMSAVDKQPDDEASIRKLATDYNLPVDAVRLDRPTVERKAKLDAIDYQTLAREQPATAAVFKSPDNAALMFDDIDNMGHIETLLNSFKRGVPALQSIPSTLQVFNQASGLMQLDDIDNALATGAPVDFANYGVLGESYARLKTPEERQAFRQHFQPAMQQTLGREAANLADLQLDKTAIPQPDVVNKVMGAKDFSGAFSEFSKDPLRFIESIGPESLVQSLPGLLAAIPATMTAGPLGTAAAMGGNSSLVDFAGELVGNMQSAGIDVTDPNAIAEGLNDPAVLSSLINQSGNHAAVVGLFDAISGGIAGKMVLPNAINSKLVSRPLAQEMANIAAQIPIQAGLGAMGEAGGQLAAGKEIQPGDVLAEAFGELFGTPAEVMTASYKRVADTRAKAQQASSRAEQLQQVQQLAAASKVLQRDPDLVKAVVDGALAESDAQSVYIDANTLAQSGIAEQLAAVVPDVARQLPDALASSGEVKISMSDFVTAVSPASFAQSILPHVRVEGEDFSPAQAQAYIDNHASELQAEAEQAMTKLERDQRHQASMLVVKDQIKQQLNSVGPFTSPVNDHNASVVAAFYSTMGAKFGMSAESLWERMPVNVQSFIGRGRVLNQDSSSDGRSFEKSESDAATRTDTDGIASRGDTARSTIADDSIDQDLNLFYQSQRGANLPEKINIDGVERWTVNSNGQPIAQDEESIRNFWAWFGESKVVDDQGRPLVVYHGTTADFNEFSKEKLGKATGAASAKKGFFFAEDADVAFSYTFIGDVGAYSYYPEISNEIEENKRKIDALNAEKANFGFNGITPDREKHQAILKTIDTLTRRNAALYSTAAEKWRNDIDAEIAELTALDDDTYFESKKTLSEYRKSEIGKSIQGKIDEALLRRGNGPVQSGGNVMPVYLKLQNPIEKDYQGAGYRDETYNDLLKKALSNNQDGAILRRTFDSVKYDLNKETNIYVTFDSTQIKSAIGNTGEFSPENPNILHQSNNGNRGAFDPETRTITLLDNADLSTFLHESGHLFLELQMDLVTNLLKEDELVGSNDMQKQLIKDTQTLLEWFGLGSIQEWYALDFEQKRAYHEQFAESFEKYLMEGNAPSLELARVFASFRQWLKQVYQSMMQYFDNVQLTDDVRGVFDRMLATDEQIALAQQGRSMLPLFADQAKSGMSETEFAEYQAAWAGATTDAQEQLALKGVRDMQWLQNARNKTLKKLQATHETLRRDIRNEVRMEVWSQPIYQVWQFLTARLGEFDKISEAKAAKSNPEIVDPKQDSLFTAIAKLGGLDKQEMIDRWNWDQVGRAPMPVFGKPLVRKTGGLSIEAMAEKLLDEGYLSADADGRYDTRQFEELFDAELRGKPQYSAQFDSTLLIEDQKAGSQVTNLLGLNAARLDATALAGMLDLPESAIQKVTELKMTARTGLHPDIVAELFGFTSGDEMVWELAQATPPKELIEQLTDQRMLQEHGELSTPEAIQREADRALSNEARARFVATEANMLSKMTGSVRLLTAAAKEMANNMIARVKVRDLSPSLYSRAEARAAKAALQAEKQGDMPTAAAEKRNQLINLEANKAAHQAQEDISKGLRYLKKFDGGGLPTVSADYNDQIMAILDRYDFRKLSDAERNRREKSLQDWLADQEAKGLTPNIAPELLREHQRIPYKDLTVEELRGIIDAVKQIEHMGREQHKLWVMSKKRNFQELEQEVTESIIENAGNRIANARSAQDGFGKFKETLAGYFYSHIRAGAIARVLDGGKDGGKMWDYFLRPANERGEWETTQRAEYTRKLSDILTPLLSGDKLGGKGRFYPTINQSLNKTQVFAMALNMGNESNLQRLLGGEGWTLEQIRPVVNTLTADDWRTVQKIWDLFEEFRPLIAAKERRLYGKEPAWIEPKAFKVSAPDADGNLIEVSLRGGYYPVKYDPRASLQAEQHEDAEDHKRMMKAAYAAATTRRSFTKNRVDAVMGRPLLLSIDGVFNGLNEVIHDLAWHEWLIDMNKVLGSARIDSAIRTHYGPEYIRVLKQWEKDIAGGDSSIMRGAEKGAAWMRQNISAAGLSFNLMSAAMQFTGITQSIVRVGGPWVAKGMLQMMSQPKVSMQFVNERSGLMQNRARTRFRELAELRNRIQYQSEAKAGFDAAKFWLIVRAQGLVDYPTWLGAYFKALEQNHDESKAIAMADQAVIDAQGGGETKDLSSIENDKSPYHRLFSLYYNFMGTLLNLSFVEVQTEKAKGMLAAKMLMLFVVPTVMEHALRAALTPDDDDWDDVKWLTHGREILGETFDRLLGLFIYAREFKEPIKYAIGLNDQVRNYEGPTGLRLVGDSSDLVIQAYQGDFDAAFRKAFVNVIGDVTGLPSSQINKTWTGVEALADDQTDNPAALAFGYKK